MSHTPPLRRLLLRAVLAFAVIVIIGYGLFEARRLIEGPEISIITPSEGSALGAPLIEIEGTAHNAAFLSINGKEAFVNAQDHFDEVLSPPLGYTVLTVWAEDRFGRVATKSVHITINNFCSVYDAEG